MDLTSSISATFLGSDLGSCREASLVCPFICSWGELQLHCPGCLKTVTPSPEIKESHWTPGRPHPRTQTHGSSFTRLLTKPSHVLGTLVGLYYLGIAVWQIIPKHSPENSKCWLSHSLCGRISQVWGGWASDGVAAHVSAGLPSHLWLTHVAVSKLWSLVSWCSLSLHKLSSQYGGWLPPGAGAHTVDNVAGQEPPTGVGTWPCSLGNLTWILTMGSQPVWSFLSRKTLSLPIN